MVGTGQDRAHHSLIRDAKRDKGTPQARRSLSRQSRFGIRIAEFDESPEIPVAKGWAALGAGGIDLTLTKGVSIMVATSRLSFPDDMTRSTQLSDSASLEGFAINTFGRIKDYAQHEPVKFAIWTFGIGFVLGWKLKPW